MTSIAAIREALGDREIVEALIGRQLRQSEHPIDVLKLDTALNAAKDQLEEAIQEEMLAAAILWTHGAILTLRVTDAMRAPLAALYKLGQEEARAELERLGLDPPRHYAIAPRPDPDDLLGYLTDGLLHLRIRIQDDLDIADLTGEAAIAIADAVAAIPGARDIASRTVSTALFAGMGETWEQAKDSVSGWERTAILDAGTCGPCEAGDGRVFDTWEAAMVELPNGGPAVDCLGGGRCRCRAVPLA